MANVFETNNGESLSYFSLRSFLYFALFGLLPVYFLVRTKVIWPKSFLKEQVYRVALLTLMALTFGVTGFFLAKSYIPTFRNDRTLASRIIPANYIAGSVRYLKRTYFNKPQVFQCRYGLWYNAG